MGDKIISVKLDEKTYNDLKYVCKAEHRSMSGQIVFWIKDNLEYWHKETPL